MKRKLKTTYSIVSASDFHRDHSYLRSHDIIEYQYVPPVRWWQLWRWPQLFREDYHLSRADEHILVYQMAEEIKKSLTA